MKPLWNKLNNRESTLFNMKIIAIFIVLGFLLTVNRAFAVSEGTTPLEVTVNPCSIFLNSLSCESAGCYWWDGSCHDTQRPAGGEGPSPKLNYFMNISILTTTITTPGNISFVINLTNKGNSKIEGIVNYWIENHLTKKRYYEHTNETASMIAVSTTQIRKDVFLLLPVGDYFLKAEFYRTPIEIRENITDQKTFSVSSALGWSQPTKPLGTTEMIIIIAFLVLIVIVGYGIYTVAADFYSYGFSE